MSSSVTSFPFFTFWLCEMNTLDMLQILKSYVAAHIRCQLRFSLKGGTAVECLSGVLCMWMGICAETELHLMCVYNIISINSSLLSILQHFRNGLRYFWPYSIVIILWTNQTKAWKKSHLIIIYIRCCSYCFHRNILA